MGGKTKAKESGPPINATSKDEEAFIQYVHIDRDNGDYGSRVADADVASIGSFYGMRTSRSRNRSIENL